MNLRMLKQALIAYVTTSFKAIWSALTYPLTISGGRNGNVKNYRLHGNSTQSGTPTYKAPKVIQSVGDYDEASGKYIIPVKVNDSITYIYLNEPLRKVGEYEDVLDFANRRVVRNIASQYITTVDSKSITERTYSMFLSNLDKKTKYETNIAHCMSNKFKPGQYSYTQMPTRANIIQTYVTNTGASRVAYTFDGIYTLAEAQELIGDGFEVCYVLDSFETEAIELPSLPQYRGNTTYETNTQTFPSGIEVEYYV